MSCSVGDGSAALASTQHCLTQPLDWRSRFIGDDEAPPPPANTLFLFVLHRRFPAFSPF